MVRDYKRKRKAWIAGQMELAVQNAVAGETCKAAAAEFGVPGSSLQRKVIEHHNQSNKLNKDS